MNAAARFGVWLRRISATRIRVEFVRDRPQTLRQGRLYVTGSARRPAYGFLRCPCGCGETLHLRFAGERSPRWKVQRNWRGQATVTPSIWRSTGCKSHFILSEGKVRWV